MEIMNKFFSEEKSEEQEDSSKDECLQEAKEVNDIVRDGVEKGSFSGVTEQLGRLPNIGISREKFIFEVGSSSICGWSIIVCTIFLMGFIWFLPILIRTLIYSDIYNVTAIAGIIIILAIIIFNIIVIANMIIQMRFNKRYDTYIKNLRFKNIEIIDDLAAYSKVNPEKVIKDLKRAIRLKLIPQGHLCCDDLIFIISNEVYNEYKDKQAVYDRYYRKQMEERLRMEERTREMQEILNQGQRYVEKIHESNDIIKDKIISQKLDRMESVVSMIFHEVDINPQHADKLGMFMNYYLPTTEKLLEAYIEIDEKQVKGKTLQKVKKDIEESIDKIIDSFEGILDKFYQEKELDIATDISAMEILMKQDGLIE
ncbi:5-bromo-4-chloroindolyl phosphate hydrolysis family protein [Roseburia amylophila]|uniref:5-bromo-4-chloroindolyl phosphate hydrolysis family protein n=1 Tax=Roseburia amylophila TaxID=2981794 RepID=A0ABT2SC68_9FIRM|nr:5-bromo-4-chloroindolyl phosphate hydrolysis family protein [Roseburia amylophila]MCU6716631.1 5-bromo-4-chloroindolyl phosphate hydrolysis family protein [Roseburia amylophila]SCH57828.1 Uncharacterised protein [uncultured Roseburia sp.]